MIYERTADNSARFLLGTRGENSLVCVGVNPSIAEPGALDLTVTKVQGFAERNGFDSWMMLNLYPQRETDPDLIHLEHDLELAAAGIKGIVAKGASQPHVGGQRDAWVKVKRRETVDVVLGAVTGTLARPEAIFVG